MLWYLNYTSFQSSSRQTLRMQMPEKGCCWKAALTRWTSSKKQKTVKQEKWYLISVNDNFLWMKKQKEKEKRKKWMFSFKCCHFMLCFQDKLFYSCSNGVFFSHVISKRYHFDWPIIGDSKVNLKFPWKLLDFYQNFARKWEILLEKWGKISWILLEPLDFFTL